MVSDLREGDAEEVLEEVTGRSGFDSGKIARSRIRAALAVAQIHEGVIVRCGEAEYGFLAVRWIVAARSVATAINAAVVHSASQCLTGKYQRFRSL